MLKESFLGHMNMMEYLRINYMLYIYFKMHNFKFRNDKI